MHVYDDAGFRAQFPEFANSTTYPVLTLSGYFTMATEFMSAEDGILLSGATLQTALNMMTAHLAKSFALLNAGQTTAVVTGSSEGSVSVSLTPPPTKNAWQWWLATTPYGMQLRALLMAKSVALQFVGGSLERNAFRKAGGLF